MYNYRPRQCSADEAWPKPRFNRTKLKRIMRVIKRIQPVPSPDCCSLDELRGFQCSGRSFECREQSLGFSFPLSLSLSSSSRSATSLSFCCLEFRSNSALLLSFSSLSLSLFFPTPGDSSFPRRDSFPSTFSKTRYRASSVINPS